MKRYPLLDVCARIDGHPAQHEMLRIRSRVFSDWNNLLERTEKEGMAPLLKKHLEESGSTYPDKVRRSLNMLARRHREQAQVRMEVLQEVLRLFHRIRLTPMPIKGAALCCTLYPHPGLRPMRDMDILFRPSEVGHGQEILLDAGFVQSTAPIPLDHFHLPSLHKVVDGVKICIELHRGLYPNCPPWYPEVDFEQLLKTGRKIRLGAIDTVTLNDEETLHYLYQHAFRSPLTYEPYRLINVADIIGFTERNCLALDWQQIRERFPILLTALPLMHHISPWDFEKIPKGFVPEKEWKRRLEPVPFDGWPSRRLKVLRTESRTLWQVLLDTFLPSIWWLGVYYGSVTVGGCLWCFVWRHPQHVYWWKKLFSEIAVLGSNTPVID